MTELRNFPLADCAVSWKVQSIRVARAELLAMACHVIQHSASGNTAAFLLPWQSN